MPAVILLIVILLAIVVYGVVWAVRKARDVSKSQ